MVFDNKSKFNKKIIASLKSSEWVDKLNKLGVKLVQQDEATGLHLYSYNNCDVSSESENDLKDCRGIILDKNGDLVSKGFPFTNEVVINKNTFNDSVKTVDEDVLGEHVIKSCDVFESHEGAIIRVFCYQDKWFVSTNRRLNAFKSKWSSRESFGEIFVKSLEAESNRNELFKNTLQNGKEDILSNFTESLDKSKQYMFLIANTTDNRIVCNAPDTNEIFHVNTTVDTVPLVLVVVVPLDTDDTDGHMTEINKNSNYFITINSNGVLPWKHFYRAQV